MIVTKKAIGRRTVLRGLGVSLALPWLDSMVPALSARPAVGSVRRFAVVYAPNGMHMEKWLPSTEGEFALTPILEPLADFKARMRIVSGLSNNLPPNAHNGGF